MDKKTKKQKLGGIQEGALASHIFKTDENMAPEPQVVSISDLTPDMINTLIKIKEVQFIQEEVGKTFAETDASTDRTLQDTAGNKIIIRTSNFAKFAGETLSDKSGEVTAVLTRFNDTYQLSLRNSSDVAFNSDRF